MCIKSFELTWIEIDQIVINHLTDVIPLIERCMLSLEIWLKGVSFESVDNQIQSKWWQNAMVPKNGDFIRKLIKKYEVQNQHVSVLLRFNVRSIDNIAWVKFILFQTLAKIYF